MTTLELIEKLDKFGYPLTLISERSNVSYFKLYRFRKNLYTLTPEEEARVRAFCLIQPGVQV